jgi:hypothetical protein
MSSRKKQNEIICCGFHVNSPKFSFGYGLNEGYTEHLNFKYFSDMIAVKSYPKEMILAAGIERIVGNVPGVLNVIETRIFNEYGNEYSETRTTQATVEDGEISRENSVEFDLIENQYTLNGEADEMFEIKYPERDIRIKVMRR